VAEDKAELVSPVTAGKTKDVMVEIPFLTELLQPAVVGEVNKGQLVMPVGLAVAVADIPAEITGLAALAHLVKATLAERPAAVLHITVAAVAVVLAPLVVRLPAPLAAMVAQAPHHL
jgi:hypothetical protein